MKKLNPNERPSERKSRVPRLSRRKRLRRPFFGRLPFVEIIVAEFVIPHRDRDRHRLSVTQDFEARSRRNVLEHACDVVVGHYVDLQSVFCKQNVAGTQHVFDAVHVIGRNDRGQDLPVCGEIDCDDENRAEKVEKRSRKQNYQAFPGFLAVEGAFVLDAVLVFAVKSAEAAERKRAEREELARFCWFS